MQSYRSLIMKKVADMIYTWVDVIYALYYTRLCIIREETCFPRLLLGIFMIEGKSPALKRDQ